MSMAKNGILGGGKQGNEETLQIKKPSFIQRKMNKRDKKKEPKSDRVIPLSFDKRGQKKTREDVADKGA